MPLSARTRLGPYEILAPIGAGGMGEVHKGRERAPRRGFLHEMPIIPLTFQQAHTLRKPYVHVLAPDRLDPHYFRYTWIDMGWKP